MNESQRNLSFLAIAVLCFPHFRCFLDRPPQFPVQGKKQTGRSC